MLYEVYFSDAGVPKTGLSPTFEYLITAENGTDKSGSAPTITEVGGGLYTFDVTYGTTPWDVITEDLWMVIDGGSSLVDVDRYKPAAITLRGLALAKIAHKGVQNKSTGDIEIYNIDGTNKAFKIDMTDGATELTRTPAAPS